MEVRRTRVKICGMTRLEDAHTAVSHGVDALGFIFYHKSPRCVELTVAKNIIQSLPPFVDKVGVFVNASLDEVKKAAEVGLTAIQLHGDESPEYCAQLREMSICSYIIKAFRVGSTSTAADFSPYDQVVDSFLLDTYVSGAKGGTGEVFDWSIVEKLLLQRPVLLAGGLAPDNIKAAIESAQPYCLDINSGVEVSPGIKDPQKISRAMAIVQNAVVAGSLI
ncbi:phosphoribosylanthranilate isomerase [Desulforhopalus sp. 52FAK]